MEGYTILSLLLCLSVASAFSNNAILNDPVPLGLESYVIPDSSLTASSEYSADHGPKRGRLNLARVGNLRGAWCAEANNANQWIQVDLADIYRIISVATQGRQDGDQWVTSYKLACSTDGTTFHTVQDISTNPGADKIFTGNVDRNTIVTNTLPVPQMCRYVRLMPVSWVLYISLRMEIYGEGPFTDKKRQFEDVESYLKKEEQVAAEEGSNDKKEADLKKKDVLQALSDLLAELKDK